MTMSRNVDLPSGLDHGASDSCFEPDIIATGEHGHCEMGMILLSPKSLPLGPEIFVDEEEAFDAPWGEEQMGSGHWLRPIPPWDLHETKSPVTDLLTRVSRSNDVKLQPRISRMRTSSRSISVPRRIVKVPTQPPEKWTGGSVTIATPLPLQATDLSSQTPLRRRDEGRKFP